MINEKIKILSFLSRDRAHLITELKKFHQQSDIMANRYLYDSATTSAEFFENFDLMNYDVLLLDEKPSNDSDGIEILKQIKSDSQNENLDIIVIGTGEKARQALLEGAHQYFGVPYKDEVLAWYIEYGYRHNLDIEKIGDELFEELRKKIEFDKATLQLIQGDTRELVAYCGFPANKINRRLLRPITEDDLIKDVVASEKQFIIDDTAHHSDWHSTPETSDVRSWLCRPLIHKNEIVGILTLDHRSPNHFANLETDAVDEIALKAAVALWKEKVRHEDEQERERFQVVNEILEEVSAKLRSKDMLRTFLWKITEQIGCDHCTYFHHALDEKGRPVLKPKEACGYLSDQIKERKPFELNPVGSPQTSIAASVFTDPQHRSRIIGNAHAQNLSVKDYAPARWNTDKPRSMLVVPMTVGEQTIGVISADKSTFSHFSDDDRLLVEALVRRFGLMLTRVMTIESIHDISAQITKQTDLESILKQIVDAAVEMSHTTSGVIFIVEKLSGEYRKVAQYPKDAGHLEPRLEDPNGVTRQVIELKHHKFFQTEAEIKVINPKLFEAHGVRATIAIPLIYENNVIGVLHLNDTQEHIFDEIQIFSLMTLAVQAAIAVEQARLADSKKKTWEETLELYKASNRLINQIMSSREPNQILEYLVTLTLNATKAKWVSVVLIQDDDARHFRVFTHDKYKEYEVEDIIRVDGYTTKVIRSGEPEAINNTDKDDKFNKTILSEEKIKAALCLPLSVVDEDKRIGVIWIHYENPRQFANDEVKIWQLYANQAATTYYNANRITKVYRASQSITNGIEKDYEHTRNDSKSNAIISLIVAIFGIFIIFVSGVLVLGNLQAAAIPGIISGVITEAVSLMFFRQASIANKRMDDYHHELLQIRQFENLLAASDELPNNESQSQTKMQIIQQTAAFWLQSRQKDVPNLIDEKDTK